MRDLKVRDFTQTRDCCSISFQFSNGILAVNRVGHVDSRKHLQSVRRLECSQTGNKFDFSDGVRVKERSIKPTFYIVVGGSGSGSVYVATYQSVLKWPTGLY